MLSLLLTSSFKSQGVYRYTVCPNSFLFLMLTSLCQPNDAQLIRIYSATVFQLHPTFPLVDFFYTVVFLSRFSRCSRGRRIA